MRKFNVTSFLFDKQLAFVEDPSPFKVAVCSRRAGKTIACAAHLIHTALNTPDSTSLYITLSGTSGKRIIWKEFKNILKKFQLPSKVNEIELSITFPNNSVIYIAGAKDTSEIEKFRGLAMKLVYIDECQSFREYIKELIDDIIGPALMDYAGSLCLIGTPGPIPSGYFHECAVKSEEWSKHAWTFWDNPHIPIKANKTHQEVFDREMRRRGITDIMEPSVQREWFGKWVLDDSSLVIHYNKDKNDFNQLPVLPGNSKYSYIMGIDVGFKDADAIAILAYSDHSKDTYLVDELVTPKQGITELVDQVRMFQKRYDISKMVMDMGALGKKIGEEMIRRYQIPVEAADKTRKMENIALLNDALRSSRFKARYNSHFANDSYLIEIDKDKSKPDRMVVSDRFHSDIADAVLYAFKCSPAYSYEEPIAKPKPGSKEWLEQQSTEMFDAELEGMKQEQSNYNRLYGIYED
jgi:phage terminase large subunit